MKRLRPFWRQFRRERMAVLGLGLIGLAVIIALTAPLAPYRPSAQSTDILMGPSRAHWLGTDDLGRDIFSRILWGSRASVLFGVVVAGISLIVGVLLGSLAGYFGGWIDDALSRFFEVFIMIPSLFLIILIVAIFGANLGLIMVVAGLTIWPTNAKLTRAQVLTLKHEGYVDAARAAGAGHAQLLVGHILPNGLYPVIANSALQMAAAIMLEASLSFLGLGDPNIVSWGQILKSGQNYLVLAPWISVFSGIAIFLAVLAFNLVGDGVNFALNPRLRVRGGTEA
jgi:peptide/nickel transport system permease protein